MLQINRLFITCSLNLTTLALALLIALPASAGQPVVRVGVLQHGTVNWELDVIKHHQLDRKHGFDLQITGFGGKNATHVALQGGSVDVIVSDWIWVNHQRGFGRGYSFAPYSRTTGALMVKPDSGIEQLSDLQDRIIGVAGGPLDKSWLILRAYSQQQLGRDLTEVIEPRFGAPPLLNKLAQRGELDGAINFWHYAARLKADGFIPLIDLPQVLRELGVEHDAPLIGWVFSESWADTQPDAIEGLLQASKEAKSILQDSDAEWRRLRANMKAENDAVFEALVEGFRQGIPDCFGVHEIEAARKTFAILGKMGGESLTGRSTTLDDKTFWRKQPWKPCQE